METLQPDTNEGFKPVKTAALIEASYRHLMKSSTVRIVAPILDHAVRRAVAALNAERGGDAVAAPSESTARRHFKLLNGKFGWTEGFNPTPPPRPTTPPGGWRAHLAKQPCVSIEDHHRDGAEAMNQQMGRDIVTACRASLVALPGRQADGSDRPGPAL